MLAHTFAKPLDDGSKIYKLAFATFSNAFNTNYLLINLWGLSSLEVSSWVVRWLSSCFTSRLNDHAETVDTLLSCTSGASCITWSRSLPSYVFPTYRLLKVVSEQSAEAC